MVRNRFYLRSLFGFLAIILLERTGWSNGLLVLESELAAFNEELFIIAIVCELVEVCLLLLGESEFVVDGRIDGALPEELLVYVAYISLVLHIRLEGRHYIFLQQGVPVEALEEDVLFNVLGIGL